jgi:hypothetical protein
MTSFGTDSLISEANWFSNCPVLRCFTKTRSTQALAKQVTPKEINTALEDMTIHGIFMGMKKRRRAPKTITATIVSINLEND